MRILEEVIELFWTVGYHDLGFKLSFGLYLTVYPDRLIAPVEDLLFLTVIQFSWLVFG